MAGAGTGYARAYGRALRALRDIHRDDFDELLAGERVAARAEAELEHEQFIAYLHDGGDTDICPCPEHGGH